MNFYGLRSMIVRPEVLKDEAIDEVYSEIIRNLEQEFGTDSVAFLTDECIRVTATNGYEVRIDIRVRT